MGEILEFRRNRSKPSKSAEPLPADGAHILFFLGIRYERHVDEIPVQPRRRRKKSEPATVRTPRSRNSKRSA